MIIFIIYLLLAIIPPTVYFLIAKKTKNLYPINLWVVMLTVIGIDLLSNKQPITSGSHYRIIGLGTFFCIIVMIFRNYKKRKYIKNIEYKK